ncbi:MAG: glycosyltransferase family 4 protein [Anaerolineae bacterium]|jgi:glycosyltransferase involved in cell wall biosynthesis
MRIVVASSSFPAHPNEAVNAGVFVWAVVEELAAQGHRVWVLTPAKGEPIHGFSVPVETFGWGGTQKVLTRLDPTAPRDLYHLGRLMLQGRRALKDLTRQVGAESVLTMWAVPSGFWATGGQLPFVVWALGSDIWGIGRYPLGKQILRTVLRSADHIFADGYNLVDEIESVFGRTAEFLASARKLPVHSTQAASLSPRRPHFLFIGRWDTAKGPDVLLEAMVHVRSRLPEARLHMFGGGAMEGLLRQRAAEPDLRDAVTIYGYADPTTATAYLKACDALVIPSRIESIPVIFSDALASGCPVVSTAVGDMARVMREHPVGLLSPPEAPEALADAMLAIAAGPDPPRVRYGKALEGAARSFDPARSARRCSEVLEAISSRTGKAR